MCSGAITLVFCLYMWQQDDVTRWYYPIGIAELVFFLGVALTVTAVCVSYQMGIFHGFLFILFYDSGFKIENDLIGCKPLLER